MKAEILNAFLRAATYTLERESGEQPRRGALAAVSVPTLTDELTVFLSAVGNPRGLVLYGMSRQMALQLTSTLMGANLPSLDDLVISGVAELGNVITGRAITALAQMGYDCDITPPSVMVGKGAGFSTLGITRILIPLETRFGAFNVYVALQEVA